jgi:predicted DNA-binding transcriptional regulator YafY
MATNLHALIRYRTIDRCIRDRSQPWNWVRLAEECELMLNDEMGIDCTLSRRTIMYDLQHMKDGILGYHAPITYNRGRKSYEYSDTDFSINQAPLSPKTLEELDQVLLILRQFSGQEKLEGMGSVIAKLEHGLNIQRDDEAAPLIHFEHSLNAPGQKWLDILYQHIKKKECLNISYQAFGKDITHHVVSPYILKEYNNRWFLFAYNQQDAYIQNLALDRIQEVRKSLRSYERVKEFDPDVLFNDIVGVTLPENGKVTRILMEAFGKQAKYIETKPIHTSQRIQKVKKNSIVFSYDLIPNFELESKILAYADLVEVLKPLSLRNRIAARLIAASIGYAERLNKEEEKKKSKEAKARKNKSGVAVKKKKKKKDSLTKKKMSKGAKRDRITSKKRNDIVTKKKKRRKK